MKKLLITLALFFTCNVWSQSWSPPVNLDSPPSSFIGEGVIPQIEVDAAGNAFAAWCSTSGGDSVVFAARYDAHTQSWGATEQIGIANAANAILSVTSDGKAIVVWDRGDSDNPTNVIHYNSYVGGWRGEKSVDPLGPLGQIHARIGVNGTDKAIGVWASPPGPVGDTIRGGVYDFITDSWSNVNITTTSPDFFVGQPEIAVSNSNSTRAVAVWRYRDEVTNDFRIQYSVYTNAWSPVGSIASDSGITANQLVIPIVAISNDGSKAIANWMQTNHASPFIDYLVMGSVYTGSWSIPIQLSPNASHLTLSGSIGPEKGIPFYSIAFDGSGDAVDLWSFIDESLITPEYIIQARTFQSSSWSASQDISNTNDYLPQVALDGSGNGWAVWTEGTFFNPTFPSNTLATPFTKAGNVWGTSEVISTATVTFLPNIASNAAGSFFSDWAAFENSALIIQAATLIEIPPPPVIPPLPPVNFDGVIKENKFLNKTECILKAKWSASASSNVISYRIYKNGKVVATVLATSPLVFETCLHHCSAEGYEIAAVSSDNLESSHIKLRIIHK
jgi:hypothetical protein